MVGGYIVGVVGGGGVVAGRVGGTYPPIKLDSVYRKQTNYYNKEPIKIKQTKQTLTNKQSPIMSITPFPEYQSDVRVPSSTSYHAYRVKSANEK